MCRRCSIPDYRICLEDKVQIVSIGDPDEQRGSLPSPKVGEKFLDFLSRLSVTDEESGQLADDVLGILSSAASAAGALGASTGLVTGYVQSGKTRSFEALLCAAADSGYRMLIVLAGTTNQLFDQSRGRLERDFGIVSGASETGWVSIPTPNVSHKELIGGMLASWSDGSPVWERRTPLLTVLKHSSNIANVADLISELDMVGVPVLIVDDEADQASLDNNASRSVEEPTATYASIAKLRSELSLHAFVQYTATPQAPLLVSISDLLSPEYVHVLEPGAPYTGGQAFFGPDSADKARIILASDLDADRGTIPLALREAFAFFMLGVAQGGLSETRPVPPNRAMYIHPSRNVEPHQQYENWINLLRGQWASDLRLEPGDEERMGLLDFLERVYQDSIDDAFHRSFTDLVSDLPRFLDRLVVRVVNGSHRDEVKWSSAYAWVIIGGQSIDRGFTVEGLTVSYVARPLGEGNADNVQQRARFFGYRRDYLPLCRVYLDQESFDAFTNYVEHEEVMRAELLRVASGEESLKDWKRTFMLSPRMRPTRVSVLSNGLFRVKVRNWLYPSWPHWDEARLAGHNEAISGFVGEVSGWRADKSGRHLMGEPVELNALIELLASVEYSAARDSRMNTALTVTLRQAMESSPELMVCPVLMSEGRSRKRSESADGSLELMQGRDPNDANRYGGDKLVRESGMITAQFHRMEVHARGLGEELHSEVWAVGVFVPAAIARMVVAQ